MGNLMLLTEMSAYSNAVRTKYLCIFITPPTFNTS